MKRVLLFYFTFVIFSVSASSQDFPINFFAGVNIANMHESNKPAGAKYETRALFTLGVTYEYELSRFWSLETGLSYNGKGATSIQSEKIQVGLDYASVPLTVKMKTKIGLDIDLGIKAGYLIRANGTYKDRKTQAVITDLFNPWDLGPMVGLSYNIPKTYFSVFGTYEQGLLNINKDFWEGSDRKIKNSTITFGLKVNFGIFPPFGDDTNDNIIKP